jgi:hypothetical protein
VTEPSVIRSPWFSRAVHFAIGFAVTGSILLCQQHVLDRAGLSSLSQRCWVVLTVWGNLWEFVVQGVIADQRPAWKWSRKPDWVAAAAFPIGSTIAAALFMAGR